MDQIRTTNLSSFSYNVKDILDDIKSNHDLSIENGKNPDDLLIVDIFRALQTTNNKEFLDYIQRECDSL